MSRERRKSDAHKLVKLAGASLRDARRWARGHLYSLLILAPLVLSITYFTLARLAINLPEFESPAPGLQVCLAVLFTFGLCALNLSRASGELFHLRRPETFAEALPVSRLTHLHHALLVRFGRTLMLGLVLVVLRALIRQTAASSLSPSEALALLLFVLLMTLAETYAALNWIHWGSTRDKRRATVAVVLILVAACIGGLLLTQFLNEQSIAAGLAVRTSRTGVDTQTFDARNFAAFGIGSLILAFGVVCVCAAYVVTARAHERWRAIDIDYAQRLQPRSRQANPLSAGLLSRRFGRDVAAMMTRDVRLTLRMFSSAVYVAAGICALLWLLLIAVLTTDVLPSDAEALGGLRDFGWFSLTWLPAVLAIKLVCVFVVTAFAAVLPTLVFYQQSHLWLERSAKTIGADVWQAKLLYTRLMTLPPVLITVVVGVIVANGNGLSNTDATTGVPLVYVLPLLLECLWLWWVVGTYIGGLAFEMPDRPELACVVMITTGVASGMLVAAFYPMGIALYGMTIEHIRHRGAARARYHLIAEGE